MREARGTTTHWGRTLGSQQGPRKQQRAHNSPSRQECGRSRRSGRGEVDLSSSAAESARLNCEHAQGGLYLPVRCFLLHCMLCPAGLAPCRRDATLGDMPRQQHRDRRLTVEGRSGYEAGPQAGATLPERGLGSFCCALAWARVPRSSPLRLSPAARRDASLSPPLLPRPRSYSTRPALRLQAWPRRPPSPLSCVPPPSPAPSPPAARAPLARTFFRS